MIFQPALSFLLHKNEERGHPYLEPCSLNTACLLNRGSGRKSGKMHPKKSWPKLIFCTVIVPIENSNILENQPNLSTREVQNTPPKIAIFVKILKMTVLTMPGIEPGPLGAQHSALDSMAIRPLRSCDEIFNK